MQERKLGKRSRQGEQFLEIVQEFRHQYLDKSMDQLGHRLAMGANYEVVRPGQHLHRRESDAAQIPKKRFDFVKH